MKIIVMSDSHGDVETVSAISALRADALFHCGDSELPFDHTAFGQMIKVRGNCDRDQTFPLKEVVVVGDKKVLMVHGHLHNVNFSLLELFYDAKENDADIVLFGHTHLFGAEMQNDILFVNPGSTLLPRGGKEHTYAVIEWESHLKVTFKNLVHEVVETINIKTS